MASDTFRFGRFRLDPDDRRLSNDSGEPIEINARYLDALALLVAEQGKLVSKVRFLEEVWRGVPVTDEALTQCIKTLRRLLGDDAGRPQFIETVPKHGYRFIAPVERQDDEGPTLRPPVAVPGRHPWRDHLLLGGAGTIGGGFAGLFGGLFYGFTGASQPLQPGMGAVSVLLVLLSLTILVALMGGAGVAFGISLANLAAGRWSPWSAVGGAIGGLLIGAIVKLLGLDAFNLLLGQSPGDITGAGEGALLGGGVGFGAWLAVRYCSSLRRGAMLAALCGGVAGLLVTLFGGRLMGGSLDLLAQRFPGSRLRLDQIGALLGESGFGSTSQTVTGALEGALFGGCLVAAMLLARRQLADIRG
ncbi:MAG TPA: transcriptional regulator [Sphingomicrobium sp.]|nr:transcriptional regulator [Sphingomicrobium sp.]